VFSKSARACFGYFRRHACPVQQEFWAKLYPDAAFELVVSSDTPEHVDHLRAALDETRRVQQPGGATS
jgi:Methyltransferase domain